MILYEHYLNWDIRARLSKDAAYCRRVLWSILEGIDQNPDGLQKVLRSSCIVVSEIESLDSLVQIIEDSFKQAVKSSRQRLPTRLRRFFDGISIDLVDASSGDLVIIRIGSYSPDGM